MKAIITGVAGFIGFSLAERLLQKGWSVIGVDSLTDYYPIHYKEKRLSKLKLHREFKLIPHCITDLDWKDLLLNVGYVYHLAGQPGVRPSWGDNFDIYTKNNILTMQRILEGAVSASKLQRLVYASSSSLYGDAESYPTTEEMLPKPISPYGVSKLAAENLCYLYYRNYFVPTVALRYFTVYGPEQRPDMAFHILLRAVLEDRTFRLFGDGTQTRDFTYIEDIVKGTILASQYGHEGEVYNIGGGSRISMLEVLDKVTSITGKKVNVECIEKQKGDALHTAASIDKAAQHFGYQPQFNLDEGLKREWEWLSNYVV